MRFLSPEWLAAVDQALREDAGVSAATRQSSMVLLQVVTGGPDGEVAYLVTVQSGHAHVTQAAGDADAQVTLAATWDTAVAIATGTLAAHDAFTTGRLVVRGDIEALRREAPALAGLSAAFDQVRAGTTYA